jgi:hypothetical protein
MVRRAATLACVGLLILAAAPQANAADKMGAAYEPLGGVACSYGGTHIQTVSPSQGYAAPYDGVITSWGNRGFWPTATFKVARLGAGGSYTVVGSSGPQTYSGGGELTTYPARIPVRQGDVIGARIPNTTYYCTYGGGGYSFGRDDTDVATGGTGFFDATYEGQVPIEAYIERDRDGDGYGDETQDGCPTTASTQGPCPLPTTLGQTLTPFSGGQTCNTSTRVVTSSPGFVSAAPHAGVITGWSHQSQADVGTGTIRLKMFRPLGGDSYRVVGESAPQVPAPSTLNSYPARIPVNEGDKIGLATNGPVPCSQFTATGTYGRVNQDLGVGTTATFPSSNGALDIAAVLEADADGDGYGDTSQDLCPTDGTTQGQCRIVEPPPSGDDEACEKARRKLAKAKAKLKKLKQKDAAAKQIKKAKMKVKKAKSGVKKAC